MENFENSLDQNDLLKMQRDRFKQEIGAVNEELIDLSKLNSNSGEPIEISEEIQNLFTPSIFKLTDGNNELKGIFAEVVCPDCHSIKTFRDEYKDEKFGLQFRLNKPEAGRKAGEILTPNGHLNHWVENFYQYLDHISRAYADQGMTEKDQKALKLKCPNCSVKNI